MEQIVRRLPPTLPGDKTLDWLVLTVGVLMLFLALIAPILPDHPSLAEATTQAGATDI